MACTRNVASSSSREDHFTVVKATWLDVNTPPSGKYHSTVKLVFLVTMSFLSPPHSNYCTTDGWVDDFAQITALSFTYPQLFIGTNGGHLLVFKILDDLPVNRRDSITKAAAVASNRTKPTMEYKLLAATHCGPVQIIGIHPIPVRGDFSCRFPFESPLGTPSSSMQVLLVCRSKVNDEETVSSSQVQLYELYAASPRGSLLVSPVSCRSDTCSLSSSFSSRRGSVSKLLPKLTLHSVSENTLTYLPLKDSD